ncbi:MAG: MBL fold metallo-hydrolase [Bdellovibrionales bacterium]|nr:MBL fold metallo-hydrolase [Bdellovibrionales bacterium]
MRIGPYTAHALEMGSFGLDGGAMFGVVPKVLWEKDNPSDEKNRIRMHTRCLLLRDGKNHRNILIDCGLGDKDDARFRERFKVSSYGLETELARHGLKVEDITDVIGTHLHFDHLGGLTKLDSDGKLTARFPRAKVWLQERNWRHAWNPNEKDRASYLKENFEIYRGDSRLQLLQGPEEIYPGIRVWLSEGHTLGMQVPFISDGTNSILYTADIIPMSAHVRTAWVMAYDCFPLQSIEEKKTLLRECEEKNTVVFFEHCPWMHGARVRHNGRDFEVAEKVGLP